MPRLPSALLQTENAKDRGQTGALFRREDLFPKTADEMPKNARKKTLIIFLKTIVF